MELGATSVRGVGVKLKPDTLDDENIKFEHQRLRQPLFLNSVPKSGSHLLRNIMRMFVPLDQQYTSQFIQAEILDRHLSAFSDPRNMLSWGHLMFSDFSAVAAGRVRQILLVRDPYDWVMARARFFLSDEFGGFQILKEGTLSVDALMNMMIYGVHEKAPPLASVFVYNAVAWLGTGVHLIRYEDLVAEVKNLDTSSADRFFADLFEAAGIDRPDDWRERVRVGSDRKQSGTARENLSGVEIEFPASLPELQRQMIEIAAPGLRRLLGYA